MARRTTDDSAIHIATSAEIARMAGDYSAQRLQVVSQLQQIYATRAPGTQPPELTDDQIAIRRMAADMLNGRAPESLKLTTSSREIDLHLKRDAIDLVISVLGTEEFRARATEAAQLAVATDSEWRGICHDLLTTALRLEALEAKAVEFRRQFAGHEPQQMPMLRYIGTERRPSVLGIAWSTAPLSRPLEEALDAGIVSSRELKDIKNA
jgi:hypothetical protein